MNKLSKSKRDQLILVCMGVVVAIAAIYFGLITGQKKNVADAAVKTAAIRDKLQKAETTLKRKDQLAEDLNIQFQKLKAIEETMPSGDLYSWVLITMNNFIAPRKL